MYLLNRVFTKAGRKLLQSSSAYDFLRVLARKRNNSLPSLEDAERLLTSTSPRPSGGLEVAARSWPASPRVEVTVIVPCFNAERFLDQCIRSIISQETSRSLELIAIDDGSTDRTGMILDCYGAADTRVKVVHQANRGFSGARNRGIAEASGKLLVFVDSDDLLLPKAIDTLCDAYDEGGCDFVTASFENVTEDGSSVSPIVGKRTHGAPWARAYSREVWRDIEFPEDFWFEDTVQSFCIDSRYRECYIDEPVYLYRQNSKGITSTSARSKRGLDTLWITEELLSWCRQLHIPFDQEMYERVLWQLGPMLWSRTAALTGAEHKAMFSYACGLLSRCDPSCQFKTKRRGCWPDVEHALRVRNYWLWRMGVLGVGK